MSPTGLPLANGLDVAPLSGLFNNVTTSYKFYWFLSILDEIAEGNSTISMETLTERMASWTWYPVLVCRLSLGVSDSTRSVLSELQKLYSGDAPTHTEIHAIAQTSKSLKKNLRDLRRYVPYRLLSAWKLSSSDAQTRQQSQSFTNNCLYSIDQDSISINPNWLPYLKKHLGILRDFTFWHLCQYLQSRNPNVPNIAGKIVCPAQRMSLAGQTKFWNEILKNHPMHCIYSGATLGPGDYQLDHFIPWSFVSHNQLWNLIPAAGAVNASKSNHLPDLDYYIAGFASFQLKALRFYIEEHTVEKSSKALEDYCAVHLTAKDIMTMPEDAFREQLRKSFSPMIEIASNMGFESNWRYK